ncbi:MAG: hypothetical protein V1712_00485 [Patescibacteria group bacterium]
MTQPLGELIERLASRGERVVIVGKGEPVVLLPLAEYEKLTAGQTVMFGERSAESTVPRLESIDPPAGALSDDDQYFPEPL